jgi:pterin-4a-carbinolamine dehydratase
MARLSDEEIQERLSGVDGREREGDLIRKQFQLDDFTSITTHSEGGLTANDFELARRIDAVA